MSSTTYSGWDHKSWASAGLKDFGDFSECVEYCNQEDDYCDSSRGDWYWGDEDGPLEYDRPTRVIYWGTFGNDHSPGSSHNTYAEVFSEDDFKEYKEALAKWEACPEYLESEEGDEEDEDGDEGKHEEVERYGGES